MMMRTILRMTVRRLAVSQDHLKTTCLLRHARCGMRVNPCISEASDACFDLYIF